MWKLSRTSGMLILIWLVPHPFPAQFFTIRSYKTYYTKTSKVMPQFVWTKRTLYKWVANIPMETDARPIPACYHNAFTCLKSNDVREIQRGIPGCNPLYEPCKFRPLFTITTNVVEEFLVLAVCCILSTLVCQLWKCAKRGLTLHLG